MSRSILGSVAGALIATYASATECTSALTSYDQVTSMPTFPGGESSYLSRNLSEDIWGKYADVKDSYGFSFKQAIYSGCVNPDSGVGVYAGSPDSYSAFNDLYDPIIQQYHNFGADQKHPHKELSYIPLLDTLLPIGKSLG